MGRRYARLERVTDRGRTAEVRVLRTVYVLIEIRVAAVRERCRIALERQADRLELRERTDEQVLRQRVVEARAELETRHGRRAVARFVARLDAARVRHEQEPRFAIDGDRTAERVLRPQLWLRH